MASTTTTAEQLLSAKSAGVRMASSNGPVSSSSVDDEDEIYDDDGEDNGDDPRLHSATGANLSLYGGGPSSGKRRKQVRPIRFSAMQGAAAIVAAMDGAISEENDRPLISSAKPNTATVRSSAVPVPSAAAVTTAVDILDLSKAPTSSSNALPAHKNVNNKQRATVQQPPASTGAAVLDLCVKGGGSSVAQLASLKPHDSNSIQLVDASRKRRLSGNNGTTRPGIAETPSLCTLCHKSFAGRALLQKHLKDAHGVVATSTPGSPGEQQQTVGNNQQAAVNLNNGRQQSKSAKQPRTNANANANNRNPNANLTSKTVGASNSRNNGNNTNNNPEAANAAAAALAQALFLPGAGSSAAGNGSNNSNATNAAFNPAFMFLPSPWANVLPPEGLAKLIQAYQLGNNSATSNGLSANANAVPNSLSAASSPPSSSSPALPNGSAGNDSAKPGYLTNNEGRSNPTPPSTSSRSSPQPMSNASAAGLGDGEDGPANFSVGNKSHPKQRRQDVKMETVDGNNNWDVSGGINEGSSAMTLAPLPMLGGFGPMDDQLMDQKPADSLLRSTVAARLADRVECDICHKQVCNKYFLKSHKLKIHGIQPTATPSDATPAAKKSTTGSVASTASGVSMSPSMLPWNQGTGTGASESVQNPAHQPVASSMSPSNVPGGLQMPLAEALLGSLPGMFRSPARNSTMSANADDGLPSSATADSNASNGAFAASAMLRTQSPNPANVSGTSAISITPKIASTALLPNEPMPSSSMMPTDLSVRRHNAAMMRPFVPTPAQSAAAYLPPNVIAGMSGGVPPSGWRPASSWRWKETSSISRVTCDICGKELCNKYFLRTHKQNRHGIKDETKSESNNQKSTQRSTAASVTTSEGTPAMPDQAMKNDWMQGQDLNKTDDDGMLQSSLANLIDSSNAAASQSKVETARCRCSECGKRFFSPVVYRRHMGLCHGIPVLIGAEHQQKQRSLMINKLKRQSRRRQQLQKLLASDGSWDWQSEEVVFRVVSAINGSSNNDSGMETEADAAFDWPQQLCVFLKKRQQQTPSASSSCSSGVGMESHAPSKYGSTLPNTITLTLRLEERKPSSHAVVKPMYARIGDLVPLTAESQHGDQGNSNIGATGDDVTSQNGLTLPLLMPSTALLLEQEQHLNDDDDDDDDGGEEAAAAMQEDQDGAAVEDDDQESGVGYDAEPEETEPGAAGAVLAIEEENIDQPEQSDYPLVMATDSSEEAEAPVVLPHDGDEGQSGLLDARSAADLYIANVQQQ